MAKKSKNDLDDLDLDNLDFDDLDFSTDPLQDNRSPVTKIATSFIAGVKSDLLDPQNLKRRLLGILPDGYTQASNLVDEVKSTSRELYDTAANDLKPATRDFKRATNKMMPKVEGKVPKSWSKRIKEWAHVDEEREKQAAMTKEDVRNNEIDLSLAKIFDAQMEAQAEMQQESVERQSVEARLRDHKEETRHEGVLGQLDAIRQAVYREVSFQDKITAKYQRKSLELQYRQFFATRDMAEMHKNAYKTMLNNLGSIVKNTGLPEYRKTYLGEAAGSLFRDRMLNATQQSVIDYSANFMGDLRKNVLDMAKRNVQGFAGAFSNGLDQLSGGAEIAEDSGLGKGGMAATGIGSLAGGKIADYLLPYLRDMTRDSQSLEEWDSRFSYYAGSLPRLANEWALSETKRGGFLGFLERTAKELTPKHYLDSLVGDTPILQAERTVPFTDLTRRSITEIIPGYLSRIHHELAILRTGDPTIERTTYNLDKGTFTSVGAARKDMFNRIFAPSELEASRDGVKSFIDDQILQGEELSPEAREELERRILKDVVGGRTFDPTRYAQENTYSSDISFEDQQAIAEIFKTRFNVTEDLTDHSWDKDFKKSKNKFEALASAIPDPRQRIIGYRDVGYRDYLDQLGLIELQNSMDYVNYDKVWEIQRRGEYDDNLDNAGGFGGSRDDRVVLERIARGLGTRPDPHAPSDYAGHKGGSASSAPPTPAPTPSAVNDQARWDEVLDALHVRSNQMPAPLNFQTLIDFQREENAKLRAAVEHNHLQPQADSQVDLLTKILERIDQGLTLHAGDSGEGGGSAGGKRGVVGGVLGTLGTASGKFVRGVGSMYGGIFKGIGRGAKGVGDLGGGVLTRLGKWIGGDDGDAGEEDGGLKDIFVKGERTARLTAARLKLGEFRCSVTKRRIYTVEDIKKAEGPIVDRYNQTILSVEEIAKGVYTKRGKNAGKIFKKGLGFVTGFYSRMFGLATMPFTLAKSAYDFTKQILNAPRDVYVKGEADPRLLALILEKGGYFNQSSKKPIFKVADIEDHVVDRNNRIVLTLDDMRKGLVDKWGRPIRTGSRLASLVRGALAVPGKMLRLGKRVAKGAWDFGAGILNGAFGGVARVLGANSKVAHQQLDVLKDIREMMSLHWNIPYEAFGHRSSPFEGEAGEEEATKGPNGKLLKEKMELLQSRLDPVKDKLFGWLSKYLPLDKIRGLLGKINPLNWKLTQGLRDKLGNLNPFKRHGESEEGDDSEESEEGQLRQRVGEAVGWGKEKARDAFSTVKGGLQGTFESLGQVLKERIPNRQLDVLQAIHDMLDERLPAPKKKYDFDGDGYRDNSWRDQFDERRKKKAAEEAQAKADAKDNGKGDAATGGLLSMLLAKLGLGGGDDGDDSSWLDMAGDAWDWFTDRDNDGPNNNGGNNNNNQPRWKRWAKKGWDATKWAGQKAWQYGKYALPLLIEGGGTALAYAGSAAVTAGSAVAGVVSAPVLLTGAAVAAVGVGGYLAYKHFSGDKTTGPTPLLDYRLAQYGIDPTIAEDRKKLLFVESFLIERVSWRGGSPRLELGQPGFIELLQGVGISPQGAGASNFRKWLIDRFNPVFERHLVALHAIDDGVSLLEVDGELSARQKQEYLSGVSYEVRDASSPYYVMVYPFFAGATADIMPQQIRIYEEIAQKAVEAERNGESGGGARDIATLRNRLNNEFSYEIDRSSGEAVVTESETPRERLEQEMQRQAAQTPPPSNTPPRSGSGNSSSTSGGPQSNTQRFLAEQGAGFASHGAILHPGNGSGGDINDLPVPEGDGSWEAHKDLIVRASQMAGVDPGLMATMAAIESSFVAGAKNDASSASGLYQFIDTTWDDMLRKYGGKYGLSPTASRFDPRANALMGAEFLKENIRALKSTGKENITDTDLYLAHFMGAGGARTFLKSDLDANATHIFPRQANSNQSIFYNPDMTPRTIRGVYAELARRVSTRRDRYADQARELASQLDTGPTSQPEQTPPASPILDSGAIAAATQVGTTPATTPEPTSEPRSPSATAQALLSQARSARTTVSAPVLDSSEGTSAVRTQGTEAVLERRLRQEAVAEARDREGQQRNEVQARTMQSLANILTQSLETQRSMDASLREIRDTLKAQQNAVPETPEAPRPQLDNGVQRGNRGVASTTPQAPIDVRRRRTT